MDKVSVLLDKQRVKNYTFNNRYVCAPFDISKADEDGLVTDELLEIYKERRGPSLIIVEQAVVRSDGQYREKLIFIDRDECIEGLSKLAGVIHNNKQVAVIQINHAGSSADISLTGRQALAPSAVMHPRVNNSMPRDMIKKVKKHVSIPVIGSGELADIHIAEDMVDNDEVDFIALGRPIMEQPNFVEILLKKLRDMHS